MKQLYIRSTAWMGESRALERWHRRGARVDLARRGHGLKSRCLTILILAVVACWAGVAYANCDDDCKGEYVSALGECRSQYQSGQQDLHDLENCLADTRDEYDDCIDDCTSLGAGGVIACRSGPDAIWLASAAAPQDRRAGTASILNHQFRRHGGFARGLSERPAPML